MQTTKEKLILAAEKMFALEGIEGVSLRRISASSGQRNNSALQYHFGNREVLLEAILAHRMEGINQRRCQMLAELDQSGGSEDIRAIVAVVVYPFIEQICISRESYYVGFLSRYYSYAEPGEIFKAQKPWMSGLMAINERLQSLLRDTPPEVLAQRLTLMGALSIHSIADFEQRVRQSAGVVDYSPSEVFASVLVDFIHGGLVAPVTSQTLATLEAASIVRTEA